MASLDSLQLVRSSSQYAQIASGSQTGLAPVSNSDMTVEAWVYLSSNPTSGNLRFVFASYADSDSTTSNIGWTFSCFGNSGNIFLEFFYASGNSVTGDAAYSGWNPSTGVWVYVAAVYSHSGQTITLYSNGSQVFQATGTTGSPNTTARVFQIGARQGSSAGDFLDGYLGEVRVWKQALSGSTISTNYSAPCNITTNANLQGWWKLDGNYNDASGNANTLTGQNSPTFSSSNVPYSCPVTLSVSDSSAVSDTVTIDEADTLSKTDTTAVSDTPTIEIISYLNVTDTTAMSESWSIGNPIAFDNAASFSSLLTSLSGSYTVSGKNPALVAFVYSASSLFDLSPPTYNGVVMEEVAHIALPSGYPGFLAAYYLPVPATGSNTFSVTRTGTGTTLAAVVMSYDYISPDSILDGITFSSALLVNSITETLVSGTNGEWGFMGVVSGLNGTLTAGASTTKRTSVAPMAGFDTNAAQALGASYSLIANSSQSLDGLVAIMFSLDPYVWFTSQPYILAQDDTFVLDFPTIEIISYVNVTDSSAVSDTPQIAETDTISKTDSTAVSDTPTVEIVSGPSVTDSSAVSDTPKLEIFSFPNVTDTTAASDTPIIFLPILTLSVSDTSAVSDTPTILIPILVPSVSDTTAASDGAVFNEEISYVFQGDSSQITDTPTIFIPILTLQVTDSTAVSDSPIINVQVHVSPSDSTAVSDTPTLEIISYINVSDTTAVSDSDIASIVTTTSVSDTTAVGESIVLEIVDEGINVTDTSAVSDTPSLMVMVNVVAQDSTAVSDTPVMEDVEEGIRVTDTTAIGESVVISIPIPIIVTDTTAVSDTASIRRPPTIKFIVVQLGFQLAAYNIQVDS